MRLTEYLTNIFVQEELVSDEERDVIQFGLKSIGANLLGIALTLLVGSCFHHIGDAFVLYLLLFPLRKSAGGFHATSKIRCTVISAAILAISFSIFVMLKHRALFYGACAGLFAVVVWILAPIENPSKKLDETEYRVFRKGSRIVLGIESVVLMVALFFGWEIIMRCICMAFFIVSVSLVMGKIKNAYVAKYIMPS